MTSAEPNPAHASSAAWLGAARRLRGRPSWLWRDLAPSAEELTAPGRYFRATRLWLTLRRGGYTMLGCRRGRTLYRLASKVEHASIDGAIVDCGVYNGGSTVLLSAGAPSRDVWAFDSFEGLPPAGPLDEGASAAWIDDCRGSEARLREAFATYANPVRLRVVRGWFDETFPTAADMIGPVALLHADGDWFESVRLTLETFYPRISPGGYVVIDDYGFWPGAKKATDEFRARHGIEVPLIGVDGNAVFWQKP